MYKRLILLRKKLTITQSDFAKVINISQGNLSRIEQNIQPLTNRIIHDICREFNTNEVWLTTGNGDMFNDSSYNELDVLFSKFNLDELDRKIITSFLECPEQREAYKKWLKLASHVLLEDE